jgi:hypothetical protein
VRLFYQKSISESYLSISIAGRPLSLSSVAAMAQRVQAYLGLPAAQDITTTQINAIWRDKLGREDRRCALPRPAAPPTTRQPHPDAPTRLLLPTLPPAAPLSGQGTSGTRGGVGRLA